MLMWNQISRPHGDQLFVNWFADLASQNMVIEVPKYPNQQFIGKETIKIVHDVR